MEPKVFISYSWSSPGHQEMIRLWAERLVHDGVQVVLDIFDLAEGQDLHAFMEKMVVDPSITHVLVFCDRAYSEKADNRKKGVGKESQIISKEVYDKVDQKKFIPLATEFYDDGEPSLPVFFKGRIWIDFSSPEKVNENWEKLIRFLYDKPQHKKPKLGSPPAYITQNDETVSNPIIGVYYDLSQALLNDRPGIPIYRNRFFDACIEYADAFRLRKKPEVDNFAKRIPEICKSLTVARDHIIDWVLLESQINPDKEFDNTLKVFLERILELGTRPKEITSWNDSWYEPFKIFSYELFLYTIASLLRTESYETLSHLLNSKYLVPEVERHPQSPLRSFEIFYNRSEILEEVFLKEENQRYQSPTAELIKRQSTRIDIPFKEIIQADLLILLISFIRDGFWYPQTSHYESHHGTYEFFLRASDKTFFENLAVITKVSLPEKLRELVKNGMEKRGVQNWGNFWDGNRFSYKFNLDNLGSV